MQDEAPGPVGGDPERAVEVLPRGDDPLEPEGAAGVDDARPPRQAIVLGERPAVGLLQVQPSFKAELISEIAYILASSLKDRHGRRYAEASGWLFNHCLATPGTEV